MECIETRVLGDGKAEYSPLSITRTRKNYQSSSVSLYLPECYNPSVILDYSRYSRNTPSQNKSQSLHRVLCCVLNWGFITAILHSIE
jgi:hypothetical protein